MWRTKWVALRSRLASTVDTTKATGKSSAGKPSNGSSSSNGNSSSYASSGNNSSSGSSSSSSGGVKIAAAASSNSSSTVAIKAKATPPVTAAATATITAIATESAPVSWAAEAIEVLITTSAQSSASAVSTTAAEKVDEKAILLQEMRDIDADSAEQLLWRVFDIGLEYLHLVDKNKRFQTKVRTKGRMYETSSAFLHFVTQYFYSCCCYWLGRQGRYIAARDRRQNPQQRQLHLENLSRRCEPPGGPMPSRAPRGSRAHAGNLFIYYCVLYGCKNGRIFYTWSLDNVDNVNASLGFICFVGGLEGVLQASDSCLADSSVGVTLRSSRGD